jgi:ribosomal protein S18 acetylase RimI-like enzyme
VPRTQRLRYCAINVASKSAPSDLTTGQTSLLPSAALASSPYTAGAVKGSFTEPEIAFFLNIDFVNHVALVAVLEELGRPRIVGGGRYIVVQPGRAEVAFVVVDQYQGQGIGSALLRHLATLARGAGIDELIAEVLPDNTSMLKVFEKSGFRLSTRRESQVVHVTLHLV